MDYDTNWSDGKHVLITGASDGIGRELARNLANKCRKITLIARGEDRLKKLKKELQKLKADIEIYPMDVRDTEKLQSLVNKIYEEVLELEKSDTESNFREELADIILVVMNYARHLKIDIEGELIKKINKNQKKWEK